MVPPLDQVELAKIQHGTALRIVHPLVEVTSIAARLIDEAAKDTDDERVVVAVGGEVALDGVAFPLDPAGAQEGLGIRRAQAGEGDALRAGDGLAGGIQQDTRSEAGADEELRRGGGGEGAEQVVVLVADCVAGVAVDDFVGGAVRLLVGDFGGINAVVGDEDALESIKDEQPGPGMELGEEFVFQRGGFFFAKSSSGRPVM